MIYVATSALSSCLLLIAFVLYERYFVQGFLDNFTLLIVAVFVLFALFCVVSLVLRHSRFQEPIARIWLSITGIGFTYLLVDLAAGAFLIPTLSPSEEPDALSHHRLVHNSQSSIYHREYKYIQRINNMGLRGEDITHQKMPDTFRIAMLGDSFTMGKGVRDDQTFSVLVENRLNHNRELRYEVLNSGIDSYAPVLSHMQLKHRIIHLDPDLVVYNFDVGDLMQERGYRAQATLDNNGKVTAVDGHRDPLKFTLTQQARIWANEHLYLSRLAIYHLQHWAHQHRAITVENVVGLANPIVLAHTLASDTEDRSRQWIDVFDSILEMRDVCTDKGVQFLLVIYPWGHQVNETEWIPGRFGFVSAGDIISDRSVETIIRFAAENNMTLLDLFPAFRAHAGELLYYKHDMHWTPAGHRLVAMEIADFLKNNKAMQRKNDRYQSSL